MSGYSIKTFGEECLREKSVEVEAHCRNIGSLIDDMTRVMRSSRGVGLAAPQIGINKRVIVFDSGDGPVEILNPEITRAEGEECAVEGCLSVPGAEVEVRRAASVVLKGLDRNFRPVKYSLSDLPARIVQHEIDHLDGILIIDRMSLIKRKVFEKKWKKSSR